MSKRNKIIIAAILAVLVGGAIFAYSFLRKSPTVIPTTDAILFYGRECPHCQDLEKFLDKNKIAEKVKFDSVEVWHNDENANLFFQKIEQCGLKKDEVGVPFLYTKEECLMGGSKVEEFFQKKI